MTVQKNIFSIVSAHQLGLFVQTTSVKKTFDQTLLKVSLLFKFLSSLTIDLI